MIIARHYPGEILHKSAGLARVVLMQVKDEPSYARQGRIIRSLQEKEKPKVKL